MTARTPRRHLRSVPQGAPSQVEIVEAIMAETVASSEIVFCPAGSCNAGTAPVLSIIRLPKAELYPAYPFRAGLIGHHAVVAGSRFAHRPSVWRIAKQAAGYTALVVLLALVAAWAILARMGI